MNRRHFGVGLVLILLQACGGDSPSGPGASRVVVTPQNITLDALGATQQYTARLEDKKGTAVTGVAVTWSSSDSSVASVSASGMATALKPGVVRIQATAQGLSGNSTLAISPVPTEMTKVAGDQQVGAFRQLLPAQPTVEVRDANGNPLEGLLVYFSVTAGGGSVSKASVATGVDGRASTTWELGCSNENPQRLTAVVSGLIQEFTATADLSALAICQETVPEGRETHPYSSVIVAAGGDPGTTAWSVGDGTLPPGLTLHADGSIDGTPMLAGSYEFQAVVQDGLGESASAWFGIRICEAPLVLAAGESRTLSPSGPAGCGFFLPSGGNGDRYRIGVIYTAFDHDDEDDVLTVTVDTKKEAGQPVGPQPAGPGPRLSVAPASPTPFVPPAFTASFREALRIAEATEALHHRIRQAERELLRNLGPDARPLPDRRALADPPLAEGVAGTGPRAAAPASVVFTNPDSFTVCTVGESRRATKIGENDVMVIYQDSIQRIEDPVAEAHAQWMLDYYASYGKSVIDSYFGGTTDINGDGKIVVFVTPRVEEGTAAFVWSGDFFPKTPQPGWGPCAASNEMELMRFSQGTIAGMASGNFQALATLVHEVKHISSLYNGIFRGDMQPLWVEEGTAEIAGELSSRLAWEATGGPAVGAMIAREDFPQGTDFTRENYGIILRAARTVAYLSSQPNGVVVTPLGAASGHSVYGSGWHFHRWLGDAYGNASTRLGDSAFFRELNDSLTASGVQGVEAQTGGKGWADLLAEYAAAVMLSGTPAPQGPTSFTTYDFPSLNRSFNYDGKPGGDYPWPVNVIPVEPTEPPRPPPTFATTSNTGPIGPSGLRILDLASDGTGLGLEVKVTAESAGMPVRVVVVRLQ